MELTRKQFDVLSALAMTNEKLSQRDLEEITGHSLGTINKAIKDLAGVGYVSDGEITSQGVDALELSPPKKNAQSMTNEKIVSADAHNKNP